MQCKGQSQAGGQEAWPHPHVYTEDSFVQHSFNRWVVSVHCLWQSGFADRPDQIPALRLSV